MKDLIEKLKDKTYVRALGLMTPEEQKCFRDISAKNCLKFYTRTGWKQCDDFEYNSFTYIIKPDYQPEPEPEFVDLEIKEIKGLLGTYEKGIFDPLYRLPSLPNFEEFWYEVTPEGISITSVSGKISQGHTVFARFRSKP